MLPTHPIPLSPLLRLFSPHKRRSTAWIGLASCLVACTPAAAPEDPLAARESFWDANADVNAIAEVSLGESTTCVTTVAGQAKCWGRADGGRLGQGEALGTLASEPAALEPLALGAATTMVVTNGAQSFARLDDGRVQAFGINDAQQLGLPHTQAVGDDETPDDATVTTLVPLAGPVQQLAAGKDFACARLDTGRVQCWGRGDEGQLGRGVQPGTHAPDFVSLDTTALEITAGVAHACALLSSGAVRCWGDDTHEQLGRSSLGNGNVALGGIATQVVAGGTHTCARLDTGALRCWGDDAYGQLGYERTDPNADGTLPADAGDVPLDGLVTQVAAGLHHTCALLDDGGLRCWGDHVALGLAPGDEERGLAVTPIALGEHEVIAVFAGALAEHGCALLDDGGLRCWGRDDHGQVGLGYTSPQDPVEGPPGDLPDVIIVEDLDDV